MRIGYFISHFPYEGQFNNEFYINNYVCSGGEIVALELACKIAKLGNEVFIYTSSVNNEFLHEKYKDLNIYRYPKNFVIGKTNISFSLINANINEDLDIIHAHHTTAPGVISALNYCRKNRKKLIITHHGFEKDDGSGDILRRFLVNLNAKYLIDVFFKKADIIITPSSGFIKESLFLKKYIEKVKYIPNGISLKNFNSLTLSKEECCHKLGIPPNSKIILFLASLLPRKGPDILIKAMKTVVAEVPNAFLVIGCK